MPGRARSPGVIGMSFASATAEQAAEQLQLSAQVFQHSGEGIVITDTNGKIIALNRAFEASPATPHKKPWAIPRRYWLLAARTATFTAICGRRCTSRGAGPVNLEPTQIRRGIPGMAVDHRHSAMPKGRFIALSVFYRHDQPQGKERAIYQLANYDSLTLLPNRHLFSRRARLALAAELAHGGSAAMLFVDLDGFKLVNDITGPHAGDALLVAMARRLHSCLDDDATRWPGWKATIF